MTLEQRELALLRVWSHGESKIQQTSLITSVQEAPLFVSLLHTWCYR